MPLSFIQSLKSLHIMSIISLSLYIFCEITDESKIQEKISKGVDIFNRGFKLQKINIDENFPEYIRNNKFLLKDWII